MLSFADDTGNLFESKLVNVLNVPSKFIKQYKNEETPYKECLLGDLCIFFFAGYLEEVKGQVCGKTPKGSTFSLENWLKIVKKERRASQNSILFLNCVCLNFDMETYQEFKKIKNLHVIYLKPPTNPDLDPSNYFCETIEEIFTALKNQLSFPSCLKALEKWKKKVFICNNTHNRELCLTNTQFTPHFNFNESMCFDAHFLGLIFKVILALFQPSGTQQKCANF